MQFTSFLEEGRLTVALTGEIDHQCAKSYIDAITSKIEVYMPKECILDFEQVSFMDSSGIAVVLRTQRKMLSVGGTLAVCSVPMQAKKVFDAAGINRLVNMI